MAMQTHIRTYTYTYGAVLIPSRAKPTVLLLRKLVVQHRTRNRKDISMDTSSRRPLKSYIILEVRNKTGTPQITSIVDEAFLDLIDTHKASCMCLAAREYEFAQ